MSTTMTFVNRAIVRPPDKGSFPLDHEGNILLLKHMFTSNNMYFNFLEYSQLSSSILVLEVKILQKIHIVLLSCLNEIMK